MDPAALQVLHQLLAARRGGSSEVVALPGADLRGAQLLRADLVGADLAGAGLDHAQLAGAKLGRARLSRALLRHADLAGADLTGADLRGADLSEARFEGVCLASADLRGASVEGAIGEPASVAGMIVDQAMCERSQLCDEDIVWLWHAGAIIEDLEHFDSMVIRHACVEARFSDAGPPDRRVADIEAEARRAWLDEDDRTAPSLRASVDLSRLSSLPPSTPLAPVSMRTLKLTASVLTPDVLAAPEWGKGDVVMGVTLDELVGEGNSARVWRGKNQAGEDVALKLFRGSRIAAGLSLPAFRRGVAVMNRLGGRDAPGGVIELEAVSLNRLGMMMRYAANGSAVDLPALGWQIRSVVEFMKKLGGIVAGAHGAGALHRCLKPCNVLLDADLNPLLADFDMVDLPTLASDSPRAGGYLAYAAPEELLGQGTQSPTADVYSLGRILHFLLLGSEPELEQGEAARLEDLGKQPPGLVRIVRKCTARAPESRYQQVDELLADLEVYDDVERVGLAGDPGQTFLPYRVSSLSHRTPWLAGRAGRSLPAAPPPPRGEVPARPRRRVEAAPPREPFGVSRKVEQMIGALGALLLAGSVFAVVLAGSNPRPQLLSQMHLASVGGAVAASLLLPRATSHGRFWRLVFVVIAAACVYVANLPALAAPGADATRVGPP